MTSMSHSKRFILLGDAGAGKSSFINFLYNYFYGTIKADEIFCDHRKVKLAIPCANWLDCLDEEHNSNNSERDIYDQTKSQTQICMTYTFRTKDINLQIIDTPGFNDTNGADIDEKNLASIEQTLKSESYLNGMIFVVNGAIPRLGVSFKNFLHLLRQVWPNDLLNNCVAILTNCDQLSVNLDSSVLHSDLHVDENKTFHFQNSLFRWNRTYQSPKAIRRFREDFEENIEKTDKLLRTLSQFADVSTKSFEIGSIKIILIEKCIFQSIQSMIDLIKSYNEQDITLNGIDNARSTMISNTEWEKSQEINVFRWVEVPQNVSSTFSTKPKFTRQTFFSDMSTASANTNSSSKDEKQRYLSNSFSGERLQPNFNLVCYDQTSSKTDRKHSENDKSCKKLQRGENYYENNQYAHPKPTKSLNLESRSSAHDSATPNMKASKNTASFRSTSISTRPEDDRCNINPTSLNPLKSNNQSLYCCSRKSSNSYDDNYINYSSYYQNSPHQPIYQQESTKIQVKLPDNVARSHYDYAQEQEHALQQKTQWLLDQQEILRSKLKSLLNKLKEQVAELRAINKNYDIIERNRSLLVAFQEVLRYMGDSPKMNVYYKETVNILSKK